MSNIALETQIKHSSYTIGQVVFTFEASVNSILHFVRYKFNVMVSKFYPHVSPIVMMIHGGGKGDGLDLSFVV